MIVKSRCEAGCEMGAKLEYKACARCKKAVVTEVESPQERAERIRKENAEFIKIAEDARPKILDRFKSLDEKDQMMVNLYIGGQWQARDYPSPFTPIGRACGIILMAEAMMVMVPEERRPWMKDGVYLDMDDSSLPDLP